MSDLPSPSKSPTAATFQLRSATEVIEASLVSVPPFMSQTLFCPVSPLRHRMSDLPSPLKSPTPAIFQLRSVVGRNGAATSVAPFICQIAFCPVALLCHRMSDLPSPSKSLVAWRVTTGGRGGGGGGGGATVGGETDARDEPRNTRSWITELAKPVGT